MRYPSTSHSRHVPHGRLFLLALILAVVMAALLVERAEGRAPLSATMASALSLAGPAANAALIVLACLLALGLLLAVGGAALGLVAFQRRRRSTLPPPAVLAPGPAPFVVHVRPNYVELQPGQSTLVNVTASRLGPGGQYVPVPEAELELQLPARATALQAAPTSGRGALVCRLSVDASAGPLDLQLTALGSADGLQSRAALHVKSSLPSQIDTDSQATGPHVVSSSAPPELGQGAALAPGWQFVVVQGTGAGQVVPLRDRLTIGRNPDNALCLGHRRVSRYHAVVEACDDGYRLTDLSSRLGTWINGERIATPTLLRPNDRVVIGETLLRLEVESALTPPLDSSPR